MVTDQPPSAAGPAPACGAGPTTVRTLNDTFRRNLPRLTNGDRLIVTSGLGQLTIEEFAGLLQAVSAYTNFGPDNDPHGEHDFGSSSRMP